jgi:hypothetical protein
MFSTKALLSIAILFSSHIIQASELSHDSKLGKEERILKINPDDIDEDSIDFTSPRPDYEASPSPKALQPNYQLLNLLMQKNPHFLETAPLSKFLLHSLQIRATILKMKQLLKEEKEKNKLLLKKARKQTTKFISCSSLTQTRSTFSQWKSLQESAQSMRQISELQAMHNAEMLTVKEKNEKLNRDLSSKQQEIDQLKTTKQNNESTLIADHTRTKKTLRNTRIAFACTAAAMTAAAVGGLFWMQAKGRQTQKA